MSVIAIDPGESIGVVSKVNGKYFGRTIKLKKQGLSELWAKLRNLDPEVVVYEEFALRQGAASKLVGDKFLTCQVVGVIKLYCEYYGKKLISLQPSNKEFCGFSSNPKDEHYLCVTMTGGEKITEHTRDAYRLMKYAELFKGV